MQEYLEVEELQSEVQQLKAIVRKARKVFAAAILLVLGLSVATWAYAEEGVKKSGKMEYMYKLNDETVLGAYGDENDEFVADVSVGVSTKAMTHKSKQALPGSDTHLGAFSLKDGARDGHYGDGAFNVPEE